MSINIFANTPQILVKDSAGLVVGSQDILKDPEDTGAGSKISSFTARDANSRDVVHRDDRLDAAGCENSRVLYSISGKVLANKESENGATVCVYNANGQNVYTLDARNVVAELAFDGLGRPVARSMRKTPSSDARNAEIFVYGTATFPQGAYDNNAIGELVLHCTDAGMTKCHSYNLIATPEEIEFREVEEACQRTLSWPTGSQDLESLWSAHATTVSRTHQYNQAGTLLGYSDSTGFEFNYPHDSLGREKAVDVKFKGQNLPDALIGNVDYDERDKIASATYGNGANVEVKWDYDRMCPEHTLITGKVITDSIRFNPDFDAAGNIRGMVTSSNLTWVPQSNRIFTYNSLYWLKSSTGMADSKVRAAASSPASRKKFPSKFKVSKLAQCAGYTESFKLDSGCNLVSCEVQGVSPKSISYNVAGNSNLAVSSVNPGDVSSYFDARGNRIKHETYGQFTWNDDNQLQSVQTGKTQGLVTEEYVYPNKLSRYRKTSTYKGNVESQNFVRTTRYFENIIFTSVKNGDGSSSEHICYVLDLMDQKMLFGGPATGFAAASVDGFGRALLVGGRQGQALVTLGSAGNFISYEEFSAYGDTTLLTVAPNAANDEPALEYCEFHYSGEIRDDTGLYYYGARYYAPAEKRWLSPDPSGIAYGLNQFAMVKNNPVTACDFLGLMDKHTKTSTSSRKSTTHGGGENSESENEVSVQEQRLLEGGQGNSQTSTHFNTNHTTIILNANHTSQPGGHSTIVPVHTPEAPRPAISREADMAERSATERKKIRNTAFLMLGAGVNYLLDSTGLNRFVIGNHNPAQALIENPTGPQLGPFHHMYEFHYYRLVGAILGFTLLGSVLAPLLSAGIGIIEGAVDSPDGWRPFLRRIDVRHARKFGLIMAFSLLVMGGLVNSLYSFIQINDDHELGVLATTAQIILNLLAAVIMGQYGTDMIRDGTRRRRRQE